MEPKPLKDILREALDSGDFHTQEELAQKLGISSSSLSNYMRGTEPRYSAAVQILDRLGLLFESVEPYQPRDGPASLADLKACLTGLDLPESDIDFLMDFVTVRTEKRRRKGQGRAATA